MSHVDFFRFVQAHPDESGIGLAMRAASLHLPKLKPFIDEVYAKMGVWAGEENVMKVHAGLVAEYNEIAAFMRENLGALLVTYQGDNVEYHRSARAGEIRFTAAPFHPYTARVGNRLAMVSTNPAMGEVAARWMVTVYLVHPTGDCQPLEEWAGDGRDDAFRWAYEKLMLVTY